MSGQFLSNFLTISKLISFIWESINLVLIASVLFLYIYLGLNWGIKILFSFLVISQLLKTQKDVILKLLSLYREASSIPKDIKEIEQIDNSQYSSENESKNINFMFLLVNHYFFSKDFEKLRSLYFTICLGVTVIVAIWNSNFLDLVLSSSVEFLDFLIKLWNSKF